MDQVDLAELLVTKHLESAIAAARGIRIQTRKNKQSLKKCIVCDDQIPLKRRRLIQGCTRCVECEEDHEKRRNMAKRNIVAHDALDQMVDDIYLANL